MIALLLACNGPDEVEPIDSESAVIETELTWYRDVKPIVDEHCTRCHYDGGAGTGDFEDVEHVDAIAEYMLSRAQAGEMPPAVSDPECRPYHGQDHLVLDGDELAVFEEWVLGGRPLGDPQDDPQIEVPSGELEDPDLTVLIAEGGYTPTYADQSQPGNEYRCFVLDLELDSAVFVTDMAPIVDKAEIVHHVVLSTAKRSDISESKTGPQGYDCINGSGVLDGMVGAWAPGMLPVSLPEGYGLQIGADEVVVLQMHYFASGPETEGLADRSGYAFKTVPAVDTEVLLAPVGIYNFNIPAGDEAYTDGGRFKNDYPVSLEVHAVFPHMHVLGSAYDYRIEHTDGSETCLATGRYDFHNQMTYQFEEPAILEPGASIEFSCTWNNSESNPELIVNPPQDTHYGERTDEEMCFFFTFVNVKI
mgnify:CR=1 FL=1